MSAGAVSCFLRTLALALALLAGLQTPVVAQSWPSRPIRLVVPLSPGGASDLTARVIAAGLAQRLGQPVTVENRPGAGGNIAIEHVARAAADGYTVLMVPTMLVINGLLAPTHFDPLEDFAPVLLIGETAMTLVASNRFSARTPGELQEVLASEGAALTCASAGGIQSIACGLLRLHARAQITTVPYRGGSQVLNDLVSGAVDLTFSLGNGASDFVKVGRVRALASTDTPERAAAAGMAPLSDTIPGFTLTGWQALVVPAGTSPDVVSRLHRETAAVLEDPEARRRLVAMAIEPVGSTPEQLAQRIRADVARYSKVVREAGLRAR
jgi:tripartite-type tricarboxylate transporter receptor subunit TctC